METRLLLESCAGALLFAAAFLVGGRVHPLRRLVRDPRGLISFGAGISVAYVFVHMMPELQGARRAFAESASVPLRYEGMAIYFVALLGFLVFYGIEHLRSHAREAQSEQPPSEDGEGGALGYRLHLGGFAAYVWIMSYLLVHGIEGPPTSVPLYAAAITAHFLALDHSLREEHGEPYVRRGRFLLAAACLVGWGTGIVAPLPAVVLAPLMAFIAGAVIMNSTIMELPSEKDGRLAAFVCGGVVYGLVLIPLG